MALTTDELALPYPETTDDAEPPADFLALATRLEAILTAGDVALFSPGDFKTSARSTSHGRWLLCDGSEKTAAEIVTACGLDSGDADALVTLLGTGGASIYGTASSGKVRLPDPRSKFILHAGPGGGGLSARARADVGGAETVTLTADQSGVHNHTHSDGSLVVASHTHDDGSLAVASHTHSDGTLSAVAHNHSYGNNTGVPSSGQLMNEATNATSKGQINIAYNGHIHFASGNTASAGADVTGTTGAATPDVTGATGSAAPDVSGSTGNPNGSSAGGSDASSDHANMPPFVVLGSLFIRV